MRLVREVARVLRDLVNYAVATKRLGLLLVVVGVALAAATATTVTTVGPFVLYPFL